MKKKVLILTMLMAFFVSFSCSKADNHVEYQLARSGYSFRADASPMAVFNEAAVMHDSIRYEEERFDNGSSSDAVNLSNTERKLIKHAFVRIRVENLDAADVSINELMNKYNAYAASTEAEENSRYYSLRVPATQYDTFLAEMSGMGRMIRRSESTEDVTLRYYDLEGRLEMKRELLRTFQAYLTRARTIEEILSVEARIAELQNDIEGTGVQLRHLANRVDYATIDLSLQGPVAVTQKQNETLGERVKQLLSTFGIFLSTVAVVIIGLIIYGIPSLILLALLFWVLFGRIGLIRKLWALLKRKE